MRAAQNGQKKESLDWLEKSHDRYLPRKETVLEEPLFSKTKKTERFRAMMKKHFPDKVKD